MGPNIRAPFAAAILLTLASTGSYARPSLYCAAHAGQASGSAGFVVLSDSGAVMPASEAPQSLSPDAPVSGFIACVPIDLAKQPRVGAVNFKIQIYSVRAVEAANQSLDYDGPHQYSAQVRQFRTVARTYPQTSIDTYQRYHGCNDPNHPGYIRYDDYGLSTNFHTTVANQRTDATPQQRTKFVFSRDVPPNCGFEGAFSNFIALFGVQPAYGASFETRLDGSMQYRRSALRRYNLSNTTAELAYVAYRVPAISRDQCLRVEASNIFDQNTSNSILIGHVCR